MIQLDESPVGIEAVLYVGSFRRDESGGDCGYLSTHIGLKLLNDGGVVGGLGEERLDFTIREMWL